MNLSKTLSAAVAAVSIVGAVGLAYAQTTNNDSAGSTPGATSSMQPNDTTRPATMPSGNMNRTTSGSMNRMPSSSKTMPSTPSDNASTTTTTTDTSSSMTPKADRN